MIFTIVFIAICLGFVAIAVGYFVALPFVDAIGPDSTLFGYIGAMAGILTLGIPMLGASLYMARKFTPFKVNYRLNGNLFIPWLISLGLFASAGFKTIKDNQAHGSATYSEVYDLEKGEILQLEFDELGYENYMSFVEMGNLTYYDKKPFSENVNTFLIPSNENNLKVESDVESRGSSRKNADMNVKKIKPQISFSDNTLKMAQLFEIGKNSKYRGQEILHKIHIPIGTKVEWNRWPNHFKYNSIHHNIGWTDRNRTKTWEMTKDGLVPFK